MKPAPLLARQCLSEARTIAQRQRFLLDSAVHPSMFSARRFTWQWASYKKYFLRWLMRKCGTFEQAYSRGVQAQVGGVPAVVASIEDLITLKRIAGRSKDLADITELEALRKEKGTSDE